MNPSLLDWKSADTEFFRNFLITPTGEKVMAMLFNDAPKLIEDGTAEKILVRSGSVKGYGDCLANLQELAFPTQEFTPEKNSEQYPPL